MDEQNIRTQVKELISKSKTEEAIELLSRHQFSKLDKELIILNGQYNRVKEELRLNVISREEGERKINQINLAILDLSNKLGNKKLQADVFEKPAFNKQLLWLLAIPVFGLIGFLIYNSNGTEKNPETSTMEQVTTANPGPADSTPNKPAPVIPEPVKPKILKVKFVLDKLTIIKDGDGPFDGDGEFFWEIKVNNKVLDSRSRNNFISFGDGKIYDLGQSQIFELSIDNKEELKLVANISELDDGLTGGDDRIEINKQYSADALSFPGNKIISENMTGTHPDGSPSVNLSWKIIQIE